eukprot:5486260-Pleurochrysis_carterae.AAC.1
MHTNNGARDSQAPSDQGLYTARDKLTAASPKCYKAVALENYQLQCVEFVEKEMNCLLKYEDASLINHCIIMGAHVDASATGHYNMGTSLQLAAHCPIEQIQNYVPLVLKIVAEKYLQARATRTFTHCPRVRTVVHSCVPCSLRSRSSR